MKNTHQTSHLTAALAVAAALITANSHAAQPSVPGTTTIVYTTNLAGPQQMDFAADGTMYVGHDFPPGGTFQKIWQIGPGGSPVTLCGDRTIQDADGLAVDRTGSFTGTPGMILVGGLGSGVSKVTPSCTVTTLYPGTSFGDIDSLLFDHTGRLLIADKYPGKIWWTTAAANPPSVLCSRPGACDIAEDATGRLWVSGSDTCIALYNSNGVPIDPCFVAGVAVWAPLASSADTFWGTNIYTVGTNGTLLRVDLLGQATPVGSGFGIGWIHFAEDGSLYVSEAANNRILKITHESPLMSIRVSQVEICWTSYSNYLYNVQYRSDLTTNVWVDLFPTNILATGSETCVFDDIPRGRPQRYYRVVELP
jgi:hypothetical protein